MTFKLQSQQCLTRGPVLPLPARMHQRFETAGRFSFDSGVCALTQYMYLTAFVWDSSRTHVWALRHMPATNACLILLMVSPDELATAVARCPECAGTGSLTKAYNTAKQCRLRLCWIFCC